jgi:hypothetical protein
LWLDVMPLSVARVTTRVKKSTSERAQAIVSKNIDPQARESKSVPQLVGRPSIPPDSLVKVCVEAGRHPGQLAFGGRVANWAGHARGAAVAGLFALPRPAGVLLADPAAVSALKTGHWKSQEMTL